MPRLFYLFFFFPLFTLSKLERNGEERDAEDKVKKNVKYYNKRIFKLFKNQDLFSGKNLY
jgi:hypothetical protein